MGKNGKILKFPEPVKKSALSEFCAYWQSALDRLNEEEEIARALSDMQKQKPEKTHHGKIGEVRIPSEE